MKINVDLGRKISEPSCCAPVKESKDRVYYPTLYIETKSPLKLPEEGTITLRYKKVGYSERNDHYTCEIEAHEVISAVGKSDVEPPSKRDTSADEALDTLAAALKKEKGY